MCKPRLLKAEEIDCRVQQVAKNGKGCSLLLYKDARCDMAILDETFGEMNWKRSHEFKNGSNYCTVSVYDPERKEWISREDIGTPSLAEKEKGEASDAFKRACVNFGIGRELYTTPNIWIPLDPSEVEDRNGKYSLSFNISFRVGEIYYYNREICGLTILDNNNKERFKFGCDDLLLEKAIMDIEGAENAEDLKITWKQYKSLNHPILYSKCKQRMADLGISK